MTHRITRRLFLGSVAALPLSGHAVLAAPPKQSLRPVLRDPDFHKRAVPDAAEIIRDNKLSGRVAYALADTETGAWLERENERQGTPPASVTKIITALYALDTLGPEHRFKTRLIATGGIVEGAVMGDLVLVGGGDPTLDTDGLATLAANLKAAGITEVKGDFKVYAAALPVLRQIDPEQPDHVGYNPGISGLALNYNRVHFEWRRGGKGYSVTMDGRSDKYRPAVAMAEMRVINRNAPVYTYIDEGGKDKWTVASGALGNGGARWLPVRKPALYAGDVFATLAGAQGIRLGQPQRTDDFPQGETLVTRESDDLRRILRDMLKYSTNLTAEMVGLAATQRRIGSVKGLRASAAEMNRWAIAKLGMVAPKLIDHSGLGDDSTVTAQDMATALVKMSESDLRAILKPIALRDDKGRPMRDHPLRIDAKTGTLNFVSGLAGYETAPDGRIMAFAIFAANEAERDKIAREDREGPPGARSWNIRAKRVQQGLLERWGVLYGS